MAAEATLSYSRPRVLARVAALPARRVLAGLVAASFAVRWLLAFAHQIPLYFPDEYLYSSLAHGLATSGAPVIRDDPAPFRALLEPLLAAPLWLAGDVELAYRLTQGLHAFAMSLAAIPVYLLARHLGLGKWFAIGCGTIAVALPDLFYAAFIIADPIGYPLVLGAVYAGVRVLSAPTHRTQVAFLALSGLATFARVQFVVLPAVLLLAALVVHRGNIRRLVRELRVTLAVLALPLAVLVLRPSAVLGLYTSLGGIELRPATLAQWVGIDLMMLAYSAGWILVPGALVGLALAVVRPRDRAEAGFAAIVVFLTAATLLEAATIANYDVGRYHERYLFFLLPLVAPAFGLWLRRPAPHWRAVALIALALLALSARVPLSGFAAGRGKDDSPFLFAVLQLEQMLGVGNGALAVAALAAVFSLGAIGIAFRRSLAPVAMVATIAVAGAASAGAVVLDARATATTRDAYLPADARWIDNAGFDSVALLQTAEGPSRHALVNLFWNRSVDRVLRLPGAPLVDNFGTHDVRVAPDGALLLGAKPVRMPLLVQNYGATVQLTGATRVRRATSFELWRPDDGQTPRLSLLANGRYADGWLSPRTDVVVWPDASGRARGALRFELSLPSGLDATDVRLRAPGVDRTITLRPGATERIVLRVASTTPWALRIRPDKQLYLNDFRRVSLRSTAPVYEPAAGPAASTVGCRTASTSAVV